MCGWSGELNKRVLCKGTDLLDFNKWKCIPSLMNKCEKGWNENDVYRTCQTFRFLTIMPDF